MSCSHFWCNPLEPPTSRTPSILPATFQWLSDYPILISWKARDDHHFQHRELPSLTTWRSWFHVLRLEGATPKVHRLSWPRYRQQVGQHIEAPGCVCVCIDIFTNEHLPRHVHIHIYVYIYMKMIKKIMQVCRTPNVHSKQLRNSFCKPTSMQCKYWQYYMYT